MVRRAVGSAVGLVLAMGSVTACGGGSEAGSSTAGAGTSESARTFLADAKTRVAESSGEIEPVIPQDSPKLAADKTVAIIPCSAAVQGCKFAADQFADAAKVAGWKTLLIDPAGDPSKMAAAVNRAVSIGADGIFTVAIDSTAIQAPLKAAKNAGIFTTCFGCIDDPKLLIDVLPGEASYEEDGYTLAAKAFVDNGGDLKAVLLKDSEFGVTVRRERGVERFVKDCKAAKANCEIVASQNILAKDISTSVPQQTAALLRKHPNWNALIASYDAPLTFVLPQLRTAGLAGEGKHAYGFDPVDINVKWIRESDVESATMASPYRWIAYAAVDQLNRAFVGEDIAEAGIKSKLIDKSSAPSEGETYLGDGDVAAGFKKAWGVGQ